MKNKLIKEVCDNNNIDIKYFADNTVCELISSNNKAYIYRNKFPLNNNALANIFDDKALTYDLLNSYSVDAIIHEYINKEMINNDIGLLSKLFNKYNNDVVIKKLNGTCGNSVYRCQTIDELHLYSNMLLSKQTAFTISPYMQIDNEYRVVVLNNNIELIYKKINIYVIGDGISTLKELIIKQIDTKLLDSNNLDDDIIKNLNNIVLENEKFYICWKYNLSKGATFTLDISDSEKEKLTSIIKKIVNNINIGFMSIDIARNNDDYKVLEINSGVMFDNFAKFSDETYKITYNIYEKAIKTSLEIK